MAIYNGLLIRDYMQDKGVLPTKNVNPTMSPDIICYQKNILKPSEAERTYDGPDICMSFLNQSINNIYVRAKNTSTCDTISGKVRLYLAPLNVLYKPGNWTQLTSASDKTDIEFVNCDNVPDTNIKPGQVALSKEPFYLEKVQSPRQHHCMFALATDYEGKWLELEEDFKDNTVLWNFLRSHKQFANRNIFVENPYDHISTQKVDFGNYDTTARDFNLLVKFTSGEETAEDSNLLIQSTDAACPFSQEYTIKPGQKNYNCKITVPPRYFGTMTVSLSSRYPKQLECAYAVRNLLSASDSGDGIAYNSRLLHAKTQLNEPVEHIGDYGMVFTQKKLDSGEGLLPRLSGNARHAGMPDTQPPSRRTAESTEDYGGVFTLERHNAREVNRLDGMNHLTLLLKSLTATTGFDNDYLLLD